MALYAIERIDDAVDMTRSFLLPFEKGRWARLVVVVAFLLGGTGGGGNVFSMGSNVPAGSGSVPAEEFPDLAAEWPAFTATAVAVILGVIATLVVLGLLGAAIGAIMEFVFVESLSRDEIHVRRYFRRYAGKGLRLFAFRVLLGLGILLVLGGTFLLLFGDVVGALLAGNPVVPPGSRVFFGAFVLVPVGITIGVVVALANELTTQFVVPVMLREDRGLLSGWRRFWPTLTGQWKQYGVYVLISFVLTIVTEIAAGIAIGIVAVAVAIPFAVIAIPIGLGVVQGGVLSAATIVLLVIVVIAYLLVVLVAAAVVYVPIKVFLRQFALLVLGDTNSAFDVLGDRRPARE